MTPDPTVVHPLTGADRLVFLKPLVDSATIEVGDYTYYDDPAHAEDFARRNVLYDYGPQRLVIGRYCCVAADTRFVMAAGNHVGAGPSTYPFTIFPGRGGTRPSTCTPRRRPAATPSWRCCGGRPGGTGRWSWSPRARTIMTGTPAELADIAARGGPPTT